MIMFMLTTPALRVTGAIGFFLLGGISPVRELSNAQIANQLSREVRGLALGLNETIFSLARSRSRGAGGCPVYTRSALAVRRRDRADPDRAGVGLVSPNRSAPAEAIVVMASPGNVVIEAVED